MNKHFTVAKFSHKWYLDTGIVAKYQKGMYCLGVKVSIRFLLI